MLQNCEVYALKNYLHRQKYNYKWKYNKHAKSPCLLQRNYPLPDFLSESSPNWTELEADYPLQISSLTQPETIKTILQFCSWAIHQYFMLSLFLPPAITSNDH